MNWLATIGSIGVSLKLVSIKVTFCEDDGVIQLSIVYFEYILGLLVEILEKE